MQKEPTKKAAGKRNAGANPPRKLSRAEKKQIAEVIRQAKGDGKAPYGAGQHTKSEVKRS